MKILIQNSYPATPHFETELELALKYLNEGHEVFLLPGTSKFKFCYFNPLNSWYRHKLAQSIFKKGIEILRIKTSNPQNLNILEYPEIDTSNVLYPNITSIEELKKFKYKNLDFGLAIASSLISYKREHKLNVKQNEDLIRNAFYTTVFVYESCRLILEDLNPDLVILFNGRFVENRPLIRICQQLNVRFLTHERAGVLGRYLIRENSVPHDIAIASEEIESIWLQRENDAVSVGSKFFEDRINRKQQGWHSYTKGQQKGFIPSSINKENVNIVIFNSSIDEYEGIDGYSNPIYRDENLGIAEVCKSLLPYSKIKIFLRIHPNLKGLANSQINELNQFEKDYENLTLIHAHEEVDSYALMENADIVLTFGSTMGLEAAFAGKPVVFAGRSFAEKLTCFHTPSSHEQIIAFLTDSSLKALDKKDCIKYGYWELNYGTRFKYYQPISVTDGTFLDCKIEPTGIFKLIRTIRKKIKKN